MTAATDTRKRVMYMLGLILAGEAVYSLPFHVTRFFRSSVLETFGLSNTELGTAHAVYGVVAMLAYFPGGPLADRFPVRKLLALSLFSTAAGGLYLATLPGPRGSIFIWGFFGVTTILLFWAALIRATREWGDRDEQGRAYGVLDSGRGVLAAVLASAGTAAFWLLFPEGYAEADFEDKKSAVRLVIYGYTVVTALTGLFVWFALSDGHSRGKDVRGNANANGKAAWSDIGKVMRMPAVWMISVIVVCAYVGFKGFDNYSLYAVQGFGLDDVEAARIAAIGAWVRPFAALGAGLLGDRFMVSRMTILCFALLLISQLFFALYAPQPSMAWALLINVLIGSSAIFGLRALYYALFEESRIPLAVTGTAVGIVSVLGYTPDIFVSYVGGVLLDSAPGIAGHQLYYGFLAAFAALGLLVSVALKFVTRSSPGNARSGHPAAGRLNPPSNQY